MTETRRTLLAALSTGTALRVAAAASLDGAIKTCPVPSVRPRENDGAAMADGASEAGQEFAAPSELVDLSRRRLAPPGVGFRAPERSGHLAVSTGAQKTRVGWPAQ